MVTALIKLTLIFIFQGAWLTLKRKAMQPKSYVTQLWCLGLKEVGSCL